MTMHGAILTTKGAYDLCYMQDHAQVPFSLIIDNGGLDPKKWICGEKM